MTHQTTSPLLPPANQLPGRKPLIHRLVRAGYRVLREGGSDSGDGFAPRRG